jgi:ATP sulfurylase
MIRLAEPHAGVLVVRQVEEEGAAAELRRRAARLPRLTLGEGEAMDLDLVGSGAASPLTGFMGLDDYRSVLERLRLADGTPWPLPFTLAVTIEQMAAVLRHGAAALQDASGRLRGVIDATDAFVRDPRAEALALHGTDDPSHPKIAHLLSRPTGTIGGSVTVLAPSHGGRPMQATPRDLRALARRSRWTGLKGVATIDGMGCLEPTGAKRPTLLPVPRVAVRRAAGRDAFLQAIVLKNFGARDVFFEHDRAEWFAASPDLAPEDLGISPLWVVSTTRSRAPLHAPAFVAA